MKGEWGSVWGKKFQKKLSVFVRLNLFCIFLTFRTPLEVTLHTYGGHIDSDLPTEKRPKSCRLNIGDMLP